MSYSGKASFDFDIERMKNKTTGELVMIDSVADDSETHEYVCITLAVKGSSYYTEGRRHGRPEDCYPDEGDTEITSIIGPDKNDWSDKITGREREEIISQIEDEVSSNDYESDYDSYSDYDGYDD